MAIYFAPGSYFATYDRNYVKDVYALKQQNNTSTITELKYNETVDIDSVIISCPGGLPENYYNDLAKDYLDGNITKDEFYSHLEDIYFSRGGWSDEVSPERKQAIFQSTMLEAHNGIMHYYMKMNLAEWQVAGDDVNFYYNSDYHYMHEAAKEEYIQGTNTLADKLGLERVEEKLRVYITTINCRMSVILSGNAGQFASLDEVPPPGTKIALNTINGDRYWASITYKGKEYKTDIPFSYDTLEYKFSLAELLSDYKIPDELKGFINNTTVANYYIARFNQSSYDQPNFYSFHSRILDAISKYEKSSIYE